MVAILYSFFGPGIFLLIKTFFKFASLVIPPAFCKASITVGKPLLVIDCVPFKELILFLKECRRVLKKDGVFSVCVPNARNYINAYIKGETFEVNHWPPAFINTGSKIDQVNYMAYMDGHHKYLFDEENLIKTLLTAGFRSAELRDFDSNLDMKERDFESIYALARKF